MFHIKPLLTLDPKAYFLGFRVSGLGDLAEEMYVWSFSQLTLCSP